MSRVLYKLILIGMNNQGGNPGRVIYIQDIYYRMLLPLGGI